MSAFRQVDAVSPSGWKPLLDGDRQSSALAAVEDIAAAIPRASELPGDDLAGGTAGAALLYCYLSRWRDSDDANTSAEHMNRAIRAAASARFSPGLYGGLAGIAWASQHVRSGFTPDARIEHGSLDEALLGYARRTPWKGDYDLISGLTGLGVYALERLPRPTAATILETVIDRLAETAERSDAGATWFTAPELLHESQRASCPEGYYNLGLAHGVPGVIGLLGRACGAGVAVEKARLLLDDAVNWLLAQRLPEGAGGSFDVWTARGKEPRPSRSAWCYGDPGVAAALLLAARSVRDAWWEGEALALAVGAAQRPPARTGVRDAGLCHGAAGLGHLYNRMYQATGDPRLAESARYWFGQTLALRRPGEGTAGFTPYHIEGDGVTPDDSVGFLTGAAGIGLALLAACGSVEPEWDRVMMCAIQPAGR